MKVARTHRTCFQTWGNIQDLTVMEDAGYRLFFTAHYIVSKLKKVFNIILSSSKMLVTDCP